MKNNTHLRGIGGRGWLFAAALPMAALLATFVPPSQARTKHEDKPAASKTVHSTSAKPARIVVAQASSPAEETARHILAAKIDQLGRAFNGDIGIAFEDVQTGWTTSFDGSTWFPQQSVSKFWVALTALSKVDRGDLDLDRPVTLHRDDLTVFHQPIRSLILKEGGYTTTLDDLLHRQIQQSDNTANDFILWKAGGPEAVRRFLKDHGIEGVRFGPGERLLQSKTAGLEWKPEYSIGNAFFAARDRLPDSVRRAAFESYIADPMDGAMPLSIVHALAMLKKGELLSPASTNRLLGIMSHTRTGPQRLKGGLESGWTVAHKTGTGQVFHGEQAGYNDIGLLTGPDGNSYAVAVMIRRTSAPLGQRMQTMQEVVQAAIDYSHNLESSYASTR